MEGTKGQRGGVRGLPVLPGVVSERICPVFALQPGMGPLAKLTMLRQGLCGGFSP